MIAVVDAGVGNLRSVVRALEAASVAGRDTDPVVVTSDPDVIAGASRVVFPGQGAFGDCARALAASGGALGQALRTAIERGAPYLGICLGLQVLFASSEEAPGCAGLGVLAGRVVRFSPDARSPDGAPLKVPHVGWNRVAVTDRGREHLGSDDFYYFVHSYYVAPDDPTVVAARTDHGEWFASAVAHGALLAVQFHPEKSQRAGLALLRRWRAR